MIYNNVVSGRFVSRPNRFIAIVDVVGAEQMCHVKNTGRCRELLVPGASVFLEVSSNPNRKTKYDLISVYKGDNLINIDSQASNKVFNEWLNENKLFNDIKLVKPETKYGTSRFDFYIEADGKKIFAETKGVTLEENGTAMFPDAPTERGRKHLVELSDSVRHGYDAYVVFIIQMSGVKVFKPNIRTDLTFAKDLKKASESGVKIIAFDSMVTEISLKINDYIPVLFD